MHGAVPCVLQLAYVLRFVIDALDDGSFAQQYPVLLTDIVAATLSPRFSAASFHIRPNPLEETLMEPCLF